MPRGLLIPAALAIAILTACGGGDGDGSTPTPQAPTPTASLTPTVASTQPATPKPTPMPVPRTEGDPYSLLNVVEGWESRGMDVTLRDGSFRFRDLGTEAVDVGLARGEAEMDLSVFVYADNDGAREDWDLVPGRAGVGRTLPELTSVWWNQNVVVVVRSGSGSMSRDALNTLLTLPR